MTGRIERSIFKDLTVAYGGAFIIHKDISLTIQNIQIFNIVATQYYTCNGENIGGPGFIFIGKNFYGSNICTSDLSTNYWSTLYAYTNDQCVDHFNFSSVDRSKCGVYNTIFGKGKCITKDVNITSSATSDRYAAMHFGYYVVGYSQSNFIGRNNTGTSIFGHSTCTNDEQLCKDMVFVDNKPSNTLLGFYNQNHRFYNSYFINNGKSGLTKYVSCSVIFEKCFTEGMTGMDVTDPITSYSISFSTVTLECNIKDQLFYYKSCKNILRIRTLYCRRSSQFLISFIILVITH